MTTTLGSSSESPPYVEAKYQEKNSNQAKVYINSCPNTETADAETENNFSFSENSLKIPKVNAQTNTSDNANCKSCGQNSTCHFVYGNENAKYKFILIRGKGGCSGTDNPCEQKSNWGQNDQKSFESFKKAVETMAKDIDYAPDGAKSFAVYRSDLVADKDPSCPPLKKFDSYGYICQGSGGSAYARFRGNAAYCLDWIKPGYPVLAHEQIGHAFAQLDDEYENCNMNPNRHPSPHYNCTDPKNLARSGLGAKTKWGNLLTLNN